MVRKVFRIVAVFLGAVSIFLLFASTPKGREVGTLPSVEQVKLVYFHSKKGEPEPVRKDCSSQAGCHSVFPHSDDKGFSAFMNEHETFMDCFVCHEVEGFDVYGVEMAYGRKVVVLENPPSGEDYHALFVEPTGCVGCHSTSGKKKFERKVGARFGKDMVNPMPLMLLKEGSRKWFVPGF